ncbi:MAG: DUF302 domain-containing protein [Candidatus Nanohalobium sp.]
MVEVITKKVDRSFEEAREKFLGELSEVGFTDVWDMKWSKLYEKKLDIEDYPRNDLIGVCNPELAYDIMEENPVNAAFLPCSVIVRETGEGDVEIGMINPIIYASSMNADGNVMEVLTEAQKKMNQAFENV